MCRYVKIKIIFTQQFMSHKCGKKISFFKQIENNHYVVVYVSIYCNNTVKREWK